MKLALLANVDKELSHDTKGGSELFTFLLASQLALLPEIERLHVFGVGQNHFTDGKIIFHSLLPTETRQYVHNSELLRDLIQNRPSAYTQIEDSLAAALTTKLLEVQDDVDLIHNNTTSTVFNALLPIFTKPTVTTLHTNAESPSIVLPLALHLLGTGNKKTHFVAIANHQKAYIETHHLDVPVTATVYNGIDVLAYPLAFGNSETGGLWVGRISSKHNKGLKEAILASTRADQTLNAFAFVDDEPYYENEIKPLLGSPQIHLSLDGETFEEKIKAYQSARYFLYPIMWEEPFGLIFLESMASGTPVIAYARGAVPEIIEDGVTGYIINPSDADIRGSWTIKKTGIEGLLEAIGRINSLPPDSYLNMRKKCRELVERKFMIQQMARNYLDVYRRVLSNSAG